MRVMGNVSSKPYPLTQREQFPRYQTAELCLKLKFKLELQPRKFILRTRKTYSFYKHDILVHTKSDNR